MIAYRNLFKRIFLLHGREQVPLRVMERAWRMGQTEEEREDLESEEDVSHEVQCVISNLISQGKMKGYLSFEHKILVLSTADPFPSSAIIKQM